MPSGAHIILDSKLTFSHHVTQAPGRLRGPYRCRSVLPENAKLNLVHLLFSVFYHYHCYPAYGNSIQGEDQENIKKLQSTAFVCVSKITYLPFELPYICLRMDVACRIQTCCLINRVLNLREPQCLAGSLVYRGKVTQRGSRQDDLLACRLLFYPTVPA